MAGVRELSSDVLDEFLKLSDAVYVQGPQVPGKKTIRLHLLVIYDVICDMIGLLKIRVTIL